MSPHSDHTSTASSSDSGSSSEGEDHDARRHLRPSSKHRKTHGNGSSSDGDDDDDEDEDGGGGASEIRKHEKRRKMMRFAIGALVFLIVLAIIIYVVVSQSNIAAATSPATATTAANQSPNSNTLVAANDNAALVGATTIKGSNLAGNSTATAKNNSSTNDAQQAPTGTTNGTTSGATTTPVAAGSSATWTLSKDCSGMNFMACWTYWSYDDPTHGSVKYVDEATADSLKLITMTDTSTTIAVDLSDNPANGNRQAIRLHSAEAVPMNSLWIADVIRMPWGCATWPAWWSNGPDWPNGGEIDIIEGVHIQTTNGYTLHVSDSECKRDLSAKITGTYSDGNNDCNANVNSNTGCTVVGGDGQYGKDLNANGGGVYATQMTTEGISIWFFPRDKVPSDIGSPDPTTWGTPTATFPSSSCNTEKYFKAQTMIINTTFCGDWAGNTWSQYSECSSAAATCAEYVLTGSNFKEAVWEFAYVRVFNAA